jgi:hypothetical protein
MDGWREVQRVGDDTGSRLARVVVGSAARRMGQDCQHGAKLVLAPVSSHRGDPNSLRRALVIDCLGMGPPFDQRADNE